MPAFGSLGDDHRDRLADEAGAIDGQRQGIRDEEREPSGLLSGTSCGFVGTGRGRED